GHKGIADHRTHTRATPAEMNHHAPNALRPRRGCRRDGPHTRRGGSEDPAQAGRQTGRPQQDGELARIEVPLAEVARLAEPAVRVELCRTLRELGFRFVTLDLEGFRSGSLNDLVSLDVKSRFESVREAGRSTV